MVTVFSLVMIKLLPDPQSTVIVLDLPEYTETNVLYMQYVNDISLNVVPIPVNFTDEDVDCLARNIYFEAKNQSLVGQLAIGIVTLKRVEDRRFPNTICGVVQHTNHTLANGFPIRNKCHFSWYCDGRSDHPDDEKAFQQALNIASALLSPESKIIDFTHGADHYHADYIKPPHWTASMIKVARIDNHIFYTQRL